MHSPENQRVLVVHTDDITAGLLHDALTGLGYPVTVCHRTEEAIALSSERDFDLAVVGLAPAGISELVRGLRVRSATLPVVVAAPPAETRRAVGTLRAGVDDYILLPPDPTELRVRIGRILDGRALDDAMAVLREEMVKKSGMRDLVARSAPMKAVFDKLRKIAPLKSTVLILGESGVGKELAARAIHHASPRKDRPFIALNCAAIPESLIESELFGHERGAFTGAVSRSQGKFELADRGTLFLDEIGEMNPSAQVKLLRVIEEREFMRVGGTRSIQVDVRVLAATNAELERLVDEGRFRRDLYFRLRVVTLTVPPLRERREDLPDLVRHFSVRIARENNFPPPRISDSAMSLLLDYTWPGNVRELKNLLENIMVTAGGAAIGAAELRPLLRGAAPGAAPRVEARPAMTIEEMERELIRRTLEHTQGNRTHTARLLRIGVRTLQRKIARYGLRGGPAAPAARPGVRTAENP